MKKMLGLFCLGLLCGIFSLDFAAVYAGHEGNGGDAVVCFPNTPEGIETRDRVEAILMNNKENKARDDAFAEVDFSSLEVTMLDIFLSEQVGVYNRYSPFVDSDQFESSEDLVANRMSLLEDKVLIASEFRNAMNGLIADENWKASSDGVIEIDDSDEKINFARNCLIVQIAYRDEYAIFYDPRLYDIMDPLNQAALVLHELTFYVSIRIGKGKARGVQEFVGKWLSKDFEQLSGKHVNDLLLRYEIIQRNRLHFGKESHLVDGEVLELTNHSYVLDEGHYFFGGWGQRHGVDPEFHDKGGLKWGVLWKNQFVQGLPLRGGISLTSNKVRFSPVEFYESGRLKSATLSQEFVLNGIAIPAFARLSLFEDGRLKSIGRSDYSGRDLVVKVGDIHLTFENQSVEFHPNGKLAKGELSRVVVVQDFVLRRAPVEFHDNGVLAVAEISEDAVVQEVPVKQDQIKFHKNGVLASGKLSKNHRFRIRDRNRTLGLKAGSVFELDEEAYLILK